MIRFKDFAPEETAAAGFFSAAQYEILEETVDRANDWIVQTGVIVLNVETVVLPNLHREDGTTDTEIRTSGDMSSYWFQFVRVRYPN